MRKVLLTVLTVSSLLAFNACKKDGATGPAGPAGATGATGAQGAAGAVGAAGAKGADGTKIIGGTVDPVAADGVVGDYFFNKTTKTLWGPKVAAGWAGTNTALSGATGATGANGATGAVGATGANGATGAVGATGANGATGAAGSSFLAGAGLPAATVGAVGDFYFDTTTSTFYGPKGTGATPWANANILPLGSAFGAKTYHLVKGFDNVLQTRIEKAQKLSKTWGTYEIFSTYEFRDIDKRRADNHTGWATNREMIFETVAGSGVYNRVPRGAFDFAGSGVALPTGIGSSYGITAGSKFRYTTNTNQPTAEFELNPLDITRLSVNGGASFDYLTYAKVLESTMVEGTMLTFARTQNLSLSDDDTNYYAEYSANTKFNLNTIVPELEKYKKEGAYVFVGYNYFANKAGNNAKQDFYGAGSQRGYVNLTDHVLGYANGGVVYGDQNQFTTTPNIVNTNPFTVGNNVNNGIAGSFGQSTVTLAPLQVATPVTSPANMAFSYQNGNFSVNWTIKSGDLKATKAILDINPLTLTNPASDLDVVSNGIWVNRTYNRAYYSGAQLTYPGLTVHNNVTTVTWVPVFFPWQAGFPGYYQTIAGSTGVEAWTHTGGQPASYFSSHRLLHLVVNVVPAKIVAQAKAKGIDVNNAEALINFSKNVKL